MIRTNSSSHAALLERYRIALDKAGTNPGIVEALKQTGYSKAVLDEGRDLLKSAKEIFDDNLKKKDEQSAARTAFNQQREMMDSTFREQRLKALLVFRNDKRKAELLAVSGKYPANNDAWLETVRKFYTVLVKNAVIQERCMRLNLTKEDAETGLADLKELEAMFTHRMKMKGVSQNSTEQKNKAFAKLNDWMSDFYAAARLALKKKPDLLEVLYKSV